MRFIFRKNVLRRRMTAGYAAATEGVIIIFRKVIGIRFVQR